MLKNIKSKSMVCGLIMVTGAVLAPVGAWAQDSSGGTLQTPGSFGNYCAMKFRAIRPSTLPTNSPQLKSERTGDQIDFYGPCDFDPVGKDAVSMQKQDRSRSWLYEYDSD
jgi:formylmethanofuran dehydrogenase subunit C